MSSIKPTVGRKVWYYGAGDGVVYDPAQPFDATVIYVWSDTCVNLRVVDHAGVDIVHTSVMLSDPSPTDHHGVSNFATWMPYQVGQAKAS